MLTELLKTSAIWAVLLLFYVAFLSREKAPAHNRFFLWLSLGLGMIIPFLSIPFSWPFSASDTDTAVAALPVLSTGATGGLGATAAATGRTLGLTDVLFFIWLAGAAIQFFLLLRNAFQLYHLKRCSIRQHHDIADYYVSDRIPAAFSFGKTIFLPAAMADDTAGLRFILQHERDHEQYHHWMDNTLLALLQIVFWFHPLFYLFKHQLKLAHEYQVDAHVNQEDSYEYARLLLTQNQRQFRKNLVHTFNYSPLKKRIGMMTKTKKPNAWKYALSMPLFMLCFVLMSATVNSDKRVRKGNITTFRGNTFEWRDGPQDTIYVVNPQTGENQTVVNRTDEIITKCNGQAVARGFSSPNGNAYANAMLSEIAGNIARAILQRKNKFPGKIESVHITNLVLDKNFKVLYYDVQTREKNTDKTDKSIYHFLTNAYREVNDLVDKILSDKQLVNPKGLQSDEPFYVTQAKADFKPISFNVKLLKN